MLVLSYPAGAAAALTASEVRDQRGALVSDATVTVSLTTIAGAAVAGATDLSLPAVEGLAGTYEGILPHTLALSGSYRFTLLVVRGTAHTPVTGILRV